jgi:transglutaminase-like putative cysteine protease
MQKEEQPEKESIWSSLKYVIAPILALLLILMIVPIYSVKLNPEPKNIPSLAELNIPSYIPVNKTPISDKNEYLNLLNPNEPAIKQIASKIASASCGSNQICQSKALYYFVRDNINYVSDPRMEYVEEPLETLNSGGADCDGMAVLLANLEQAIGIPTRFVFIPNHVYIQIYLEEAPKKYKQKDSWINLDPTCYNCEFSEIPLQNIDKIKTTIQE